MALHQTDYGLIYNDNGTLCATLRPGEGRNGTGAVAVEEGTTNLWTNPGWLDGTLSGWSAYSTDGATGERQVVPDGRFGYALRLTKVDSGAGRWGVRQSKTWHSTGSIIADSVYVKALSAQAGAKLRLYSDYRDIDGNARNGRGFELGLTTMTIQAGSNGARHLTLTPVGDGWYRVEFVTNDNDIVHGSSFFWIEGAPAEVLLAYSQKEAKPFPTSFVEGARERGRLEYDSSLVNPYAGTYAMRLYTGKWGSSVYGDGWSPLVVATSGNPRDLVYLCRSGASRRLVFLYTDSHGQAPEGNWSAGAGDVKLQDDTWYFVVGTWEWSDGHITTRVFINGLLDKEREYEVGLAQPTRLEVGRFPGSSPVRLLNGLIDELLILPYAASEEEINDWYNNGINFQHKPGHYASFDGSLALQSWTKAEYDYEIQNNRIIFTDTPKENDHILASYEIPVS